MVGEYKENRRERHDIVVYEVAVWDVVNADAIICYLSLFLALSLLYHRKERGKLEERERNMTKCLVF